jgi:hypothetical protein
MTVDFAIRCSLVRPGIHLSDEAIHLIDREVDRIVATAVDAPRMGV